MAIATRNSSCSKSWASTKLNTHWSDEPLFFRYYFNGSPGQAAIRSIATGSVQPNLNITNLHLLKVPLPPLPEQKAIVQVIGALDDKIELNRQMNETLEAMARALFQSWFVDFDPVRAKTEGRKPAGLDAVTVKLFPDVFEKSALGPVPKGWNASTMGEEFAIAMGQSPPGETYNEAGEGLPFFQGSTDFGFRFPTNRVSCTSPTRFAEAGDTLVSVRAPVGDINMSAERCSVGRGVAAVHHKSGSRSYTYYGTHTLKEHFARFEAEGTVFGSLGKQDFHRITWLAPPAEIVERFESLVWPLDERIASNERESRTLAALRDALLPKLLSGEIRVKDVEMLASGGEP